MTLASLAAAAKKAKAGLGQGEVDVSPTEDLLREHGILRRLLLVYRAAAERTDGAFASVHVPSGVLHGAFGLMTRFIHEHHEKLEERFIFPRFPRKHVALVNVLVDQHEAGRRLTRALERMLPARCAADRLKLAQGLRAAIRMYEPHAAREDTVLFPAFRGLVTAAEYAQLAERFEQEERRRFGPHAFEEIVGEVADLERTMGIADLARFTWRP